MQVFNVNEQVGDRKTSYIKYGKKLVHRAIWSFSEKF